VGYHKMPRNVTGGSGHKSQSNSEGSKARNNREFVDALLDDYQSGDGTEGVFVARVLKRMGSGRMEVFYVDEGRPMQKIVPMRGGLRGKGKKSVWVDIDSLVMISETGLQGATHEIVAVFSELQVARFKKLGVNTDPRLFLRSNGGETTVKNEGFEFEYGESDEEAPPKVVVPVVPGLSRTDRIREAEVDIDAI
jgi:hypothetical protein